MIGRNDRKQPPRLLRLSRLSEGAGRFRAHRHPAARRRLCVVPRPPRLRCRHRQYLRLSRKRAGGIASSHRPGAGRRRAGDRHRLHGRRAGKDHGALSQRVRHHRAASIRRCHGGGAPRETADARSLHRSRSARRDQADAAPLCLFEDFRRLQQPLYLLHHPETARRSRLAPGGGRFARSRASRHGGREGIARHFTGHLRLRRRYQIRAERIQGPRGAREIHRSRPRTRKFRRLGAPALRLSLPARRRGDPADGGRQDSPLSRHPVPARQCGCAQTHAASGGAGKNPGTHRALARYLSGLDDPLDLHRRISRRDRRGF